MEDFEELRHLGRGAFGEVLLMKRKSTGVLCAVKKLNKTALTAGEEAEHLQEVKALQSLQHPCILRYYGSLEGGESLSLVMEYADAGDLQVLLKKQAESEKPFEAIVLLAVFSQLVMAVAHVHQHRVLHRDLKPSNVMLTSAGFLKLGDFGVAKVLAGTTVCDQMTCVGSPTYMAPEIVSGEAYGAPCDVWSLGVILYELATFRRPFEGRSLGELVMRISSGQFQSIDKHIGQQPGSHAIMDAVNPLISKMMEIDPKMRAKMADIARNPTLQVFIASLRTSAGIVASIIADAQAGSSAKSVKGIEVDTVAIDGLVAELAVKSPQKKADPENLPKGKGEVRSSLAAKASMKVVQEEDSLAFSMTSDGGFSSASQQMSSLLQRSNRNAGEISFNLTATDATNLPKLAKQATQRRAEAETKTLTSNLEQATLGLGHQSHDNSALKDLLGDVLDDGQASGAGDAGKPFDASMPSKSRTGTLRQSSTLKGSQTQLGSAQLEGTQLGGTRALEEAVLRDAMGGNHITSIKEATSPSRQRKEIEVLQGHDGSVYMDHVNPGWQVRTAQQVSASSSSDSSPTSSPPGSGKSRPSKPRAGSDFDERALPSDKHHVPGAPSLRAAGAQLGSKASNKGTPYKEVHQRRPSRGSEHSAYSSDREHDKSVTWPAVELPVPPRKYVPHRPIEGGPSRAVRMRSTTPPAGRPTTPEAERQARLEKERLRSMQRNGALTIPFFDAPASGSQPSPPPGFLNRLEKHEREKERRERERAAEQAKARTEPAMGSRAMPAASRSVPAIDRRSSHEARSRSTAK
eukprot:TRINITY_DN49020_c0_g1_i1.p1 TRINITY_DN49020_c0_g1~~TRINITY_DN49020_c0_g1_i1.p1  ORF type:complete len:803 (-),score=183.69 TRINITY_DN49020_c0_g1_i1:106-2514(-)